MSLISSIILESSYLWPVALLACAGVTAGIVWLYPPQVRDGGWGGWTTLGLRWLALMALAVAMLKPVVLQAGGPGEGGGVEVLVDCSKSMGVVDTGRTAAQRVALAAALGKLPEGVRSEAGSGLFEQVQQVESLAQEVVNAEGDLDYARVVGRGVAARQTALRTAANRYAAAARELPAMAASAQVGSELRGLLKEFEIVPEAEQRRAWGERLSSIRKVKDLILHLQSTSDEQLYASDARVRTACDAVAKLSRLQLAEDALLRPDGLVSRLGAMGRVTGSAIDQELRPVSLGAHGGRANPFHLRGDGKGSDLTSAVAAEVAGAAGRSVRAVVLLSDGRQTGGRADVTSAIRPSGIPVFTVAMAATTVSDAWISNVTLPRSAFAGETLDGQVEVRSQGLVDPPQSVTISSSSGSQVVRLQPRVGADGKVLANEFRARFTVPIDPPDGAAAERVSVSIEPISQEVSIENNRVDRWVKVSSARLRVMAITGSANWDFQALSDSMANRRWVRFDNQVMDPVHPRLKARPQEIASQDVVVLHDVPVDALDVYQWDAVSRLVNDGGGSVIVIPDTAAWLADWSLKPTAAALLPFHDVRPTWKQWPGEQPAFHFSPTPLGERLALRLGEGAEAQHRWQELPAVYRFLQIPDKNLFGDVRKLLFETDTGLAVLTERQLNNGRAFFLGLDETWRWRLKAGERDADRFWRQLVRHAGGEPYAATRGGVSLDVDQVACEPGGAVHVRARFRRGAGGAEVARPLALVVRRNRTAIRTVSLTAESGGKYSGVVSGLPAGDYQLEINVTSRGGAQVVSVPLHVAENDELEMQNLSGDPDLLRRIARASGGQPLSIENVNRLPRWLGEFRESEGQVTRRPLYNSPLLFVFVLACLSGEWALRKRLGLA